MEMTKKHFIDEAKRLGFDNAQDLLKKLGYHERTLSRYKQDGSISKKIEKAFIEYKNDAKPVQKSDLKDIKIVQAPKALEAPKAQKKVDEVIDAEIEDVEVEQETPTPTQAPKQSEKKKLALIYQMKNITVAKIWVYQN
jgi:hypothetical protein